VSRSHPWVSRSLFVTPRVPRALVLTCTPWQWEIFVTAVKDGAFNGESWPDHGQRCACSDGIGCRCRRRARRPSSEGDSSWASTWPGPPLRGQLHRASQALHTRKTAKIVIIVNTAVPMPIHMGGSKVTVQVIPRPIWRRCAAVPGQQLVHLDLMIPTCHRSYCAMAEMRKPTPASAKLARIVP